MSNYSESEYKDDPNSSWYKVFTYIKPGSRVLDIGCSSGNFGAVISTQKNCIVDGIEVDKSDYKRAVKKLRNVYNLNIETDDLSGIGEKYDYIYFGDVIEHLANPTSSLKRIKPLLNEGGELVFSIPNMAHALVRLSLLKGDFTYGETGLLDKTHLHFYTVREVERILHESGYEVTSYSPVLKDIPKEIVKRELEYVGLRASPLFMKYLKRSEANVYQIVGSARSCRTNKIKTTRLAASSPVDIFQQYLSETKAFYEAQLIEKNTHIKKLEKLINEATIKQQETMIKLDIAEKKLTKRIIDHVRKIRH